MIRRAKDSIIWYESELLKKLSVKHGFFASKGGVSSGAFESLNVKTGIGDNEENVTNNRELIKNTLDYKAIVFSNHLPHETELVWTDGDTGSDPAVDALATDTKKLAIGLSTADCLPIIISDGNVLSVIHAGWRGTVAGIVEKTIDKLVANHGLNVSATVAACGPCICKDHFIVRDRAAQQLRSLAGESASGAEYKADLIALNVDQLERSGIKQIDKLGICSYESDEFYSFRQSNGKTGRNMTAALLS